MKPVNERIGREEVEVLQLPECPDCDSTDSRIDYRRQSFRHGRGDDVVDLNCEVPVFTCNQCGCEWTGPEAEDARQVAVCRHLGRLTPVEIRDIRETCRRSQAEFSRITGIGEASLSRWETGAQIQNASSDRLLRLILADARNLYRLEQMANNTGTSADPHFRVITITPALRERQASFRLRLAS